MYFSLLKIRKIIYMLEKGKKFKGNELSMHSPSVLEWITIEMGYYHIITITRFIAIIVISFM